MTQKQRVGWIDITRGICILAIVLGHVWNFGYIRQYLFSFHVPIFFFLSGLCFRYTGNIKEYLLKKVRTIAVPYIFFSVVSIFIFFAAGLLVKRVNDIMDCSPINNLLIMLYGNSKPDVMKYNSPLWFLACFFCVNIIAYCIETVYAKTNKYAVRIAGTAIMAVIGCFVGAYNNIRLPWHLETAASMTVWYMLGVIAADSEQKISAFTEKLRKYKLMPLCAFAMIIAGGILAFVNSRVVGVRTDSYGIIPVYYCSAFLGISGWCLLSRFIGSCRFLEYIGKSSMGILVLHKFPLLFFQEIFPVTAKYLDKANSLYGIVCGIAVFAVAAAASLIAGNIIGKLIPWALGRKRVRTGNG